MSDVPSTHPRQVSLSLRDRIVKGVNNGVTSIHGLIAHGRGEAFDYLIGEQTALFATKAIKAASAMLLSAAHPVISVNGNTAALVPDELIALSKLTGAPLEVNIFHTSKDREKAIVDFLRSRGAADVLTADPNTTLNFIDSNRRFVNPDGIYKADVIFVPLEDGDRCEAMVKMGRKVVTVDLNPLSRTARTSTVTIVNNLVRAMPLLLEDVRKLSSESEATLKEIISAYDQSATLAEAEARIRDGGGRKAS